MQCTTLRYRLSPAGSIGRVILRRGDSWSSSPDATLRLVELNDQFVVSMKGSSIRAALGRSDAGYVVGPAASYDPLEGDGTVWLVPDEVCADGVVFGSDETMTDSKLGGMAVKPVSTGSEEVRKLARGRWSLLLQLAFPGPHDEFPEGFSWPFHGSSLAVFGRIENSKPQFRAVAFQ